MLDRRSFLRNTTLAGAGFMLAPKIFADAANQVQAEKNALRLGIIGSGRRGGTNMDIFSKHRKQIIAAFADTNANVRNSTQGKHPNAKGFADYREMLDKMKGQLDAVVISTPDVSHYAAAMCAVKAGLNIYIEKPLCHTIWQIRDLYKAVKAKGVKVQMGNQSHSTEGIRFCAEWIQGGLIGTVKEVVLWTDRPLGTGVADFPNNVASYPPVVKVPEYLNWDLWQNVSQPQDYFGKGVDNEKWRGWWKYGSGSLGDIGCHMLDIPVYALGLSYPSKIVSKTRGVTEISVASQEKVDYYFKESIQKTPVKVTWHSGFKRPREDGSWEDGYDKSLLPPLPKHYTDNGGDYAKLATNGQFFIGDKGVIYSPDMHLGGKPILLPKELWADVRNNLPRTEKRIKHNDHYLNFIEAVRGEAELSSGPDYAHVLTEVVQLGNLASRTGSEIVWDSKKLVCVGNPKATALVNPPMRKGWF